MDLTMITELLSSTIRITTPVLLMAMGGMISLASIACFAAILLIKNRKRRPAAA